MSIIKSATLALALLAAAAMPSFAQAPPYGAPMSLDMAKKAMTAAEAEAKKNNWSVAIAILDTTGSLVLFQKLDNTNTLSVSIAEGRPAPPLMVVGHRKPSRMPSPVAAPGCACCRCPT